MQKSKFKILALTAALIMPLSSCKETIIYVTPEDIPNDDIKTPIELSVGGVDGAVESSSTRAEITDGKNKTLKPFDVDTKIFMIMQSEYGTQDFAGSTATKYTVSRGDVKKKAGTDDGMTITFSGSNQKYWDDAHARSSQLSIWAYAQMSQTWTTCSFPEITNGNLSFDDAKQGTFQTNKEIGWQTTQIYPAILSWSVGNPGPNQTASTLVAQDLLFSNNIADHNISSETETRDEAKDKRLKFDFTNRHFPRKTNTWSDGTKKTEMKFYHAMSKITIQLRIGEGFNGNGSDFQLNNATSNTKTIDKLQGFNTKGLFNIKDGEFQKINESADITSIPIINENTTDNTKPYYTLQALIIPNIDEFMKKHSSSDSNSRFDQNSSNVMMEFTIDGNHYKITSDALYKALHKRDADGNITTTVVDKATKVDNTYIPLEAGKNYIFTFVVGKTKIEHLTATVAEWEDVEAESFTPIIDVNQTYGVADTKAFDKTYSLLRSKTIDGNYTTESGATMTYDNSAYSMSPQLYWPDHKTHYFFRGVYPEIGTTATGTGFLADGTTPALANEAITTDNVKDVIAVKNAAYTKETYPSDLMIGIPRNSDGTDETCKVDGTGHKGSSAKGICATSGNINLNFRYAMSQVEVRLKNTTDDAAVNLTNAKVEIVNCYNNGSISLSDGGAAVKESTGNYELHTAPTGDNRDGVATTNIRHDAIVPQNLTYTTDGTNTNLRFKITIYKAGSTTDIDDIYYADIKDINVTEGTSTKQITSWEAGKHYIYTLNLKKTDIKVSATIADWVTATGSTNVWF